MGVEKRLKAVRVDGVADVARVAFEGWEHLIPGLLPKRESDMVRHAGINILSGLAPHRQVAT